MKEEAGRQCAWQGILVQVRGVSTNADYSQSSQHRRGRTDGPGWRATAVSGHPRDGVPGTPQPRCARLTGLGVWTHYGHHY